MYKPWKGKRLTPLIYIQRTPYTLTSSLATQPRKLSLLASIASEPRLGVSGLVVSIISNWRSVLHDSTSSELAGLLGDFFDTGAPQYFVRLFPCVERIFVFPPEAARPRRPAVVTAPRHSANVSKDVSLRPPSSGTDGRPVSDEATKRVPRARNAGQGKLNCRQYLHNERGVLFSCRGGC